jgi:hypothetical protein
MQVLQFVSNEFKKAGYDLLETYKNSRTKMKSRCICGQIRCVSWDGFKQSSKCQTCVKGETVKKFLNRWLRSKFVQQRKENFH